MTSHDEAGLELEIAARRLGIEIPEHLKGGVLHGYRGLREMTALLRRAAAEQQAERGADEAGRSDA